MRFVYAGRGGLGDIMRYTHVTGVRTFNVKRRNNNNNKGYKQRICQHLQKGCTYIHIYVRIRIKEIITAALRNVTGLRVHSVRGFTVFVLCVWGHIILLFRAFDQHFILHNNIYHYTASCTTQKRNIIARALCAIIAGVLRLYIYIKKKCS